MSTCQFETVGQAQLSKSCGEEATHRVEFRISGDSRPAVMAQRYCRYHAERVRDYLISGPISARIVEVTK